MFSKPKTGPRKRAYRWHRVKCNECQKEMNADHANTHMKNVHSGKKVKLTPLVETSHSQIHGFFVSGNESNETNSVQEPIPINHCREKTSAMQTLTLLRAIHLLH